MDAGVGAQRPPIGKFRLAGGDRELIEPRLGEIPVKGFEAVEAELIGAERTVSRTRFLHGSLRMHAGALRRTP